MFKKAVVMVYVEPALLMLVVCLWLLGCAVAGLANHLSAPLWESVWLAGASTLLLL